MQRINWRGVDLNLLIASSALMETRSVTKAAQKLSIGQSAMSHNLARLRELLDDPLFERQGHSMLPTQKALELITSVENVLNIITQDILRPDDFEPLDYEGIFKIGLTDYAELLFAPALFDAIHQAAPHCQLSFFNIDRHNYLDRFNQDNLDLVIGSMTQIPKEIEYHHLYTEDHVCLFDQGATQIQPPISIEQYAAIPHALVSPDGQLFTQVDNQLHEQGLKRQIAVGSRNFLTIRHLLSHRRLICVVSRLMAQLDIFNDKLTQCPPPVHIADFDINLLWLRRNAPHPRNSWLRETVTGVITEQVRLLRG